MKFKIVSVGWQCAQFIERTLKSVENQTHQDWEICVVYDPCDDNGAEIIREWCRKDQKKRHFRINHEQLWATRNQWEAIHWILKAEDDDVIVFLDLDGDQLAHEHVLERLVDYYDSETLLTYGNYKPVPDPGTHIGAQQWPADVVRNNSYRAYTNANGPCFNHLRTVKAKVFNAIPLDQFKWETGAWYKGATDYVTMIPALELANGRYRFIEEVLVLYNHANPYADNKVHYDERVKGLDATAGVLRRPPLPPLEQMEEFNRLQESFNPPAPLPQGAIYGRDVEPGIIYMSADQRREVLRAYGHHYHLNVFIETGTNDGGTPWLLRDEFRELYTIELATKLWREAERRFAMFPHVHCLHGDSTTVLPQVLEAISEPALVWLDGHYSGGVTAHGDLDTPVKQELEALFADGRNHVILVDDARIFVGGPEHDDEPHYHDYPSIQWVKDTAEANGFDFVLKDDIMRLTPRRHWGDDAA